MTEEDTMQKIISVFGAAALAADDPSREWAVAVGRVLAENGYAVMTGGYGGIMEAASEGAHLAGGHVIGVTLPNVQLVHERIVNAYLTEEVPCDTYDERLHYLVEKADGYVVMPGGVGTLQEMTEAWQQMRINVLSPRPLICYGDYWRPKVELLLKSPYVPNRHVEMVQFAYHPSDVMRIIESFKVTE